MTPPPKKDGLRISRDVAEKRALDCLDSYFPRVASSVADHIWPGHSMKAQGAGGAATRILLGLKKKGEVAWVSRSRSWGWISLRVRR